MLGKPRKPTFVSPGRVFHFNAEAPIVFSIAVALRFEPELVVSFCQICRLLYIHVIHNLQLIFICSLITRTEGLICLPTVAI